ncbi:MAG TPA: mismatch-specific DNA-glycosylase [Acidimicrobiales bacterium]|nr:mismatch-specific DNA-glycosylase [Acidimicrobiales bacterium]
MTGPDVRAPIDARLPVALARLHWSTPVGERRTVELDRVEAVPVPAETLLAGAGFAVVDAPTTSAGGRYTVERMRSLPDTVGVGMWALVCGLNPSLVAADAGYGYAGPTNRFWPVAEACGLVTLPRDPLRALLVDGVGMTDLVKRATPAAGELTRDEYRAGAARVEALVSWLRPGAVVFVGLAGWRAAVDPKAGPGWQPDPFGSRPAYLMPSTSGLNAATSRAQLEAHLRAAVSSPPPSLA